MLASNSRLLLRNDNQGGLLATREWGTLGVQVFTEVVFITIMHINEKGVKATLRQLLTNVQSSVLSL